VRFFAALRMTVERVAAQSLPSKVSLPSTYSIVYGRHFSITTDR
jgi:hypothetical protein